jgi:hypothetical protein
MTTPLTFTIQIASVTYDIKEGSFDFNPVIEERTKLTFTVLDPNNAFNFVKGQQITLTDSASTIQFTGTLNTSIKYKVGTGNERFHDITCYDLHQVADERTTNRIYNGQYSGVIFAGMTNDVLAGDGITANYAIREDNTQADFGQGTLNGTMATPNLGGDLELALAGSPVTIVENSSSVFNSGTLNNCQVSGNSLIPTPTSSIKLQGTESLTQDGNAYTYVQIFQGGGITVVGGRYLVYDVWVDPASPNGCVGVDIVFTDGSTLRDASQDYRYYDSQNIPPHPLHDIGGFAKGTWYHRSFLLDNFSGKTIAFLTVVLEGNGQGTYTAYFKNIYEVNSSNTIINTFFNGTFGVNPPKQMQNSGYSNVSCTLVNTYDCVTQATNRISPAYQIGNANIIKNSFLSSITTQPANTNILIEYTLDGGNSYITCKNNAALPSLLAGLSVGGLSIQFRQTFQQLKNASPESQPILSSMQAFLNPSYIATKSDVTLSAATSTQWNAGTLTNTQVNGGVLSLLGLVRNFSSNTDLSGFTVFGDGATGPGPTTVRQHCNLGTCWVECGINMQGDARFDTVGSWQNFRLECDLYIDGTSFRPSIIYRSTGWSNYDADYAYAAEFNLNQINLQRGSNTSAASNGTRTQIASTAISIASASWHRATLIINGSNHQILVDDFLAINQADATYGASGNIGLRVSNTSVSAGYQAQFNNFGITVIGMSGTWVSPVQSLTAAGTYGGAVVTWQDVSIGNGTTILVESTINGGSSWQTVTNGGTIPNLTLGQSLSGVNLQLRVTLSTQTASSMPQIQYLVARIMGGYSSTGTRIAPVLSLAPALFAGSTVANWTPVTPPNTSVAIATSTDNVTYTPVTNGGPIAGITTQPIPVLDTFAVDSHTNYTSTNQTGGASGTWNFDTANSRVTINNGTSAVLLWNPVWFNTGYLNKKMITVNHLQVVGGADLTNFNFPVSMIDANLATVANGGLVTNANGFDIIFVDATETTKLDHEIEKYVSATGEIEMWVRIPTLSHTVDTVIYMYFNNSGISTTQENATGVWDSNYKAVWHMDAATGSNQPDSTSNAQTAVQNNSPLQGVGEIDGGFSFDGLADYFSVAGAAVDITGDKTIELWMNAESFSIDANGADPRILINNIDGTNAYQFALDNAGGGTIGFAVNDSTGQHIIANQTSNISTWYHLVGTYVASTHAVALYINGVSVANNGSLSLGLGTSSLFNIGRRTDALGYYLGIMDEVRVSNTVRSAGWIATAYNSQSNPDAFFSVGSLTSQSFINSKDVDEIVDADAINCGGLVWRWQDASNFYQLLVYDASSTAGNTNIIQLKKIVSNVTTQIGSNVAISFTRGTYHRFHVSMIGTAINVYMDDNKNPIINMTDSSLAGPGKVGLIHVSGTGGNGDSYHNLRLQALGQSLSGVNAYTKITLNSTDPSQTPQVPSLTLAALHPNIGLGAYIPSVNYERTFFSANADDLAKKSDYYWQIDPNKNAIFSPRVEQPSPWILTSNDVLFPDDESPSTISVENSGDLYRNRMILRGVIATQFISETHPGDGSSTSWTLKLPVVGLTPVISVNGQAKTIGLKGVDTGKDFYYALGSTSLAQDASGTLLQKDVDSFTISYTGQAIIDVVRDNTGGFPGTTTQAQYAALTGGAGIVEVVEDVSSQQLSVAGANAYGDASLQRNGVIGRTLLCQTNRTGLSVGQYIPVVIPELGLNDASMLITSMDLKPEITLVGSQASMLYYWSLTLVEGPNLGSWQKTLLQAFNS